MSMWTFFVDAAGLATVALLAVMLRWAAIQRARAHREWATRRQRAPTIDWWVATWAVTGCL